jgi:hypothetical protein
MTLSDEEKKDARRHYNFFRVNGQRDAKRTAEMALKI